MHDKMHKTGWKFTDTVQMEIFALTISDKRNDHLCMGASRPRIKNNYEGNCLTNQQKDWKMT